MQVTLEIPDAIAGQLSVQPAERQAQLLLELGCSLYARGSISLAEGAEMAGLSRMDFGWELGERGIPRHYTQENLAEDLAYAGGQ